MHRRSSSAAAHHGGSAYTGGILDAAIMASGRILHAVLIAHVHDCPRYTRSLDEHELPYEAMSLFQARCRKGRRGWIRNR